MSAAAEEEPLASPPLLPGNQCQSLATGRYVCRLLRRYHSVPQVAVLEHEADDNHTENKALRSIGAAHLQVPRSYNCRGCANTAD